MAYVSWSDLIQAGILVCNIALLILNCIAVMTNKRK